MESEQHLLCINGGSSSIRFALFSMDQSLTKKLHGKIEHIGSTHSKIVFNNPSKSSKIEQSILASDHQSSTNFLINWLEEQVDFNSIRAVGHRIVHGMQHTQSEIVTPELLDELHQYCFFDSDHLPREIELIETFIHRHPKLTQVACFDTTFHHEMPKIAKLLSIPRHYYSRGIYRYGFHGLSYSFLVEELSRIGDLAANKGKVILAHLGSEASMAAVLKGKSIETTMGFSPNSGMMMSTRSGDLDPNLFSYLAQTEHMCLKRFQEMITHDSGLRGLSQNSSDMRQLIEQQKTDEHAEEAISLFCYQAKKSIGALTAALEGVDTVVFSGGIGENCPLIRSKICRGLEFLGIEVNEALNDKNASVISTRTSEVIIRVIPTDEEQMIARSVSRVIELNTTATENTILTAGKT